MSTYAKIIRGSEVQKKLITLTIPTIGVERPKKLTFPMESAFTKNITPFDQNAVTLTTGLGQKQLLLGSNDTRPRVTLTTSVALGDGTKVQEVAVACAFAKMLSGFSKSIHIQLENNTKRLNLIGVDKESLKLLYTWMLKTCSSTTVPSLDLFNMELGQIESLYKTIEALEMPLAKEVLSKQLPGYLNQQEPEVIAQMFATYEHSDLLSILNRTLRPYIMLCEPDEMIRLLEAGLITHYNVLINKRLLVTRLPREFNVYLEACAGGELLDLWALAKGSGLEQASQQISHALHTFTHGIRLTEKEVNTMYKCDAEASFTQNSIKRVAQRLWWTYKADVATNPELEKLSPGLQEELDNIWQTMNKNFVEHSAEQRQNGKKQVRYGKTGQSVAKTARRSKPLTTSERIA